MKTEFEVGKVYKTRDGIHKGIIQDIDVNSPRWPLKVLFDYGGIGGTPERRRGNGRIEDYNDEHDLDLLLPAIEPAKGFSGPTIRAMRDLQDFWAHFRDSIKCGKIDPTGGGEWPEHNDLAVISCTYPCEAAALSEAAEVIRQIDALLEGRQP